MSTYDQLSDIDPYRQGVYDGLRRHTWMRDGVTYVGNGTYTLKQAIEMVESEFPPREEAKVDA